MPFTSRICTCIFVAVYSNICAAESIFGIEIGAQFSVKKCLWDKAFVCYDDGLTVPTNHPWGEISYNINIPIGSTSWGVRQFGFTARTFQGEVIYVAISTYGERDQEKVFSDLCEKFGKPTKKSVVKLQNRMGARFDGIRAAWDRREFRAEFNGVEGQIDDGYIRIYAKTQNAIEGEKAKELWQRENKQGQSL